MAVSTPIDQEKVEAFVHKVLEDTSATTVTVMAAIGDQLGLFKDLAANGPATSAELAGRVGIAERYAREWLGSMTAAGYLAYDPATTQFGLPPEHAPALAQEGGPFFFGGVHQMMVEMLRPYDRLVQAFREGGGVPQAAYSDTMYEGMYRFTTGWFEHLLVQQWIPAMPDVQTKLEQGALAAAWR